MEVLKNLSESELTNLRDRFLRARNHALDMDEFEEVLTAACASKPSIDVGKLHLRELFNDIDINGDNTVSWDEFTMFLISGEPLQSSMDSDRALKRYNHVKTLVGSEIPNSVVETRYIPKLDKALRIMRREKSSRLRLCYPNKSLGTFLEVPRSEVPMLSAEYIPYTSEVARSGVMAVSFSDSVVRFYDTRPSKAVGAGLKEMPLLRETKLLESQTVMRWSTRYNRLVMGSRTGVVSVLDVDQPTVFSKEKLHNLLVSDMTLLDDVMFTASLDAVGSVKCVDLERSVVQYSLEGHAQGSTMLTCSDYHSQLFTAGFELFVLAYSIALPRLKPYRLDDPHRPHKGRIIGLEAVPGSPQVITADSTGLLKVWDLRMYNCVQNITPSKDDGADAPSHGGITSIGFLPPRRRLVVNGRDTTLYDYDEAGDPHLSDDYNCTSALYNPLSHSFLSVHDGTIKLWDGVTGAPRLVQRSVVPTDITCVCLATPLCRRFFAGTMGGKLYNIGYAMGAVLRVFDSIGAPRRQSHAPSTMDGIAGDNNNTINHTRVGGAHTDPYVDAIVCLHYMESFRDTDHQYVVVGMNRQVALVPDADEHVQRSILNLHCLESVLGPGGGLVKDVSVIHSNFVVVATSDGRVHVADLTSFALVLSYGGSGVLRGEVSSLWAQNLTSKLSQSSALLFITDASGMAHCVFAASASRWTSICSWSATGHHRESLLIAEREAADVAAQRAGEGSAETPLSARKRAKKAARGSSKVTPPTEGCGEGSPAVVTERPLSSRLMPPSAHGRALSSGRIGAGAGAGAGLGLHGRGGSIVKEYFRAERRDVIYTALITCLAYVHDAGLLAVADDKGFVALWDVAPLLGYAVERAHVGGAASGDSSCVGPQLSHPTLIHYWACHSDEVTSISCFERDGRLMLLTTALDKTVKVSSLDGMDMGNLAQGRSELDQEGDPSRHIQPFLVSRAPAEGWAHYDAYTSGRTDVHAVHAGYGSGRSSTANMKAAPPMSARGAGVDPLSASAGSLEGTGRRPSSRYLMGAAPIPRPPSSGASTHTSARGGGDAFLTGVGLASNNGGSASKSNSQTLKDQQPSTSATYSPPRGPLPSRLQGLVKVDTLSTGVGGVSRRRTDHQPAPLSHTTLPPISPRSARGPESGANPSYPTRVGEYPRYSEYLRSNLCASTSSIDGQSPSSSGPAGLRDGGAAHVGPMAPSGYRLQATPRIVGSPRSNPLSSMDAKAKAYLRTQGHNDNPFESMKEHALRTKGNVVLGTYTEASNRVM